MRAITREELIEQIEAANLTSPEIVADFVLAKLDSEGEAVAVAELAAAIANEPSLAASLRKIPTV